MTPHAINFIFSHRKARTEEIRVKTNLFKDGGLQICLKKLIRGILYQIHQSNMYKILCVRNEYQGEALRN